MYQLVYGHPVDVSGQRQFVFREAAHDASWLDGLADYGSLEASAVRAHSIERVIQVRSC